MNNYPIQDLIRLTIAFTDAVTGEPVDPSDVTLTLELPDNTTTVLTTSEVSHPELGSYYYDLVVSQMGLWIYRWQGSGAVVVSSGDQFFRGV